MKKLLILILVLMPTAASAKIDLATLPKSDAVELTIYNSADLTFASDTRSLTVKKGDNKLQFSWAGTLIDPTSLEMTPLKNAGKVDIADLTFPPRVRNLGLWNVDSRLTGILPVKISYFTSGITWKAFYMGTLSKDESKMQLQGYVRVTNYSGEDYKDASVRLVVGKVNLLDQIAALSKRQWPYGRPGVARYDVGGFGGGGMGVKTVIESISVDGLDFRGAAFGVLEKKIKKQGLSEYFLYSIPGKETIPNRWSKRLPSLGAKDIPVVNLYKYEEEMYGSNVTRFLSFKNDEDHELGETPIPGGAMKIYRDLKDNKHLSYTGQSSFKYIPVNEKVELNLGAVKNIVVKPTRMNYTTKNYRYNNKGNISGWTSDETWKMEIKNTRDIPVEIEIKRNFHTTYWEIETKQKYEKYDKDTIKIKLKLKPNQNKTFQYILTKYHGKNQRNR
ncbi:MAG: DUF4139 domain-containing protein [Planctomycetes bacterium]|nr:DUF4139 domain-containing protein [Planctomycetota bacterium]